MSNLWHWHRELGRTLSLFRPGDAAGPAYTDYDFIDVRQRNPDIATQQPGTVNCGIYVFAFAYFFAFHNQRFPTAAQCDPEDVYRVLRHFFFISPLIRLPLMRQ